MEKKTGKNYFNYILTTLVVLVVCVAIVLGAILGTSSHDEIKETPDNLSFDNILNSKYLNNNPINLSFGDKKYPIKDNATENLQNITKELYIEPQDARVIFDPLGEEVFIFQDEVVGQEVDVNNLALFIQNNIKNKSSDEITIPTNALAPNVTKKDLEGLVQLRSEYSTSIVGSEAGRKHNVSYAIKAFNGMTVLPDQTVSFNEVTGERTFNSEYQDAIIINEGKYVKGKGGGVCQASTTLYNALIRSDVEIEKVQNHSLPVKYVPLAFDAMVNDTTSDLVFKNTTGSPLYFLTGADDEKVWVKIFGAPLEDGLKIDTRTETIREIKKGDKIIPDTNGEYANKITFKGEYYRVKYPTNGKECKGYLQYFKNGELVEEKEVRHVYYQGQEGIIMEGTEEVYDGVTLPDNDVEFITGN